MCLEKACDWTESMQDISWQQDISWPQDISCEDALFGLNYSACVLAAACLCRLPPLQATTLLSRSGFQRMALDAAAGQATMLMA